MEKSVESEENLEEASGYPEDQDLEASAHPEVPEDQDAEASAYPVVPNDQYA